MAEAWLITGSAVREATCLLVATEVILSWHSEELEPLKVVFSSLASFIVDIAALDSTVDDVDCGAKSLCEASSKVDIIGLVEAAHDVVHTWFGVLRCHKEPDTCSKRQETVLVYKLGILEQVHLAIIVAWSEDV